VDGSQARGDAVPWSSEGRFVVNFNNGNVNNNNANNTAFARAVRVSGEYQGAPAVSLHSLYRAWQRASRGKKPSANQMTFNVRWADRLLDIQRQIEEGTWSPLPTTCFIATRPKAREIHAPDFSDRVVHHWLVPQLEAIYEPRFIHDSYANRTGKGSHAAVRRARQFIREVHSGQGGGYYLQLDVHNFFNSIHRPTLWAMLKKQLMRAGLPSEAQKVAHALIRRGPVEQGVIYRATPAQRALVPSHKQLVNANAGCGLPIGNLSSQFLANVYLDALDQFVKHELKAKRYLRYVDDFVLFHEDQAVLAGWQARIERFLSVQLRLRLKDDIRLRPLGDGLDFLGYVLYPTHTRVRRRVVSHAKQALVAWSQGRVVQRHIRATPTELRAVQSIAASYAGHFKHANSFRLRMGLRKRFPWLLAATFPRRFHPQQDHRVFRIPFHRDHAHG
jgi:RNA-directed DNA polymerase